MVCTGATMQCAMGTTPSNFAAMGAAVTTNTPVGVVTDITLSNIPPFGLCQSPSNPQVAAATAAAAGVLTPQPCMPLVPAPWAPGSSVVALDGVPVLDDSSQCTCAWGGAVSVTSPGQSSATVA